MRKVKTFVGVFLLGILICGIISGASFFVGVQPMIRNNNVIKNGTKTQAVVITLVESSASINKEATYHLKVMFTNENDEIVEATSLDYLDLDASRIINNRIGADELVIVDIIYVGNDVIVAPDDFSTTSVFNLVFVAACIVTGLLAVLMVVMLVKTFLQASVMNKALTSGEVASGKFMEMGKGMTMGNTKYFSVTYQYKNADGIPAIVKSPKNYISSDVELLRQAGDFDVRLSGKTSVIAFDFDNYVPSSVNPSNNIKMGSNVNTDSDPKNIDII